MLHLGFVELVLQYVDPDSNCLAVSHISNDILALHNAYRAAHSAPALSWDSQLQSKAQSWANNLASNCQFYHSGSGENLASGFASWADAAYAWYVEYEQYNYNAPGYSAAVGHFTQMVWLGTTKLGCATANSKCSQGVIYVCQYDPPGNVNAPQYFRDNASPAVSYYSSNDILALHNAYRAAHSAPALSWDSQLQSKAQSWANNLASNCQFYHSGSGENLASGFASWADAAYAWYVEYKQYNYNAPGYSAAVGHFTQMVWLGTTKLGCATANSKCSQGVIYVCQYDPPGNVNAPQYFRDNASPAVSYYSSNDILALHNAYRAAHSAPALSWDSQLQSKAQSWANNLASNCQFYHSGSGENLASGFASWADAAYAWYVEYEQYNYNAPGYSAAVGHFTQMVWLGTTKLGCATANSKCSQGVIYVCQYDPPGNVNAPQYFRDNVRAPSGSCYQS
ncbi:CAP domain-containing protein [Haematococcus lacustris]